MVRHELPDGKTERVQAYGVDDEPFSCKVSAPETRGEFCFPPIAALITGAARLQLALLERCVTDLGGTYAMEDTDSMAIVATKAGGLVSCPGGPHRMGDVRESIQALSWAQVREIVAAFEALRRPILAAQEKLREMRRDGLSPGHGGDAALKRGAKISESNRRRSMGLTQDEYKARRADQARARRNR